MSEDLTVLVVEDNLFDVELMRELLPERGAIRFHVESVSRLSEALARLANGGIDLALIDLGLPDSQGLDTFRKLRQAAPDVAMIVLTGNDDQESALAAVREGAQDYLVKGQVNGDLLVRAARYAIERINAGEALRQSEEKYRTLVESAGEVIVVLDESGLFVFMNHIAAKILGGNPDDFVGKSVWDLFPKEFADRHVEAVRHVIRSGQATVVENQTVVGGTTRWFRTRITPLKGAAGLQGTALIFASDITDRKNVQDALFRLEAAIEQAGEVVAITDRGWKILYANAALEAVTGYSRDKAIGQVLETVVGDAHAAAVYRDITKNVEHGDTWRGRVTARKRDDTAYQVDATLSPVLNPAGQIVNFVCVWRDITREVEIDAELRHAHKMEAIGMLADSIAHSFRNILSSISGFSEIALKLAEKGSDIEMCLTRVTGAANKGADVVQRMMTFSRREEIARRPLDMGVAIKEAMEFLRGSLSRAVEFRLEIDSPCDPVLVDPAEIHQVILDLGSNACHAMGKRGGVLQVSLRQVTSVPDHLGLAPGKYAQLLVSDTGHGIPAEIIEHIFEPFFTTKPAGEGTGLGLSTVHGVVTSLGGAIQVHSEVGKGAEFTLFLPVCLHPDGTVEETPWDEADPGGRERVLFVDDDASLVVMAEMGLGALGYTVEAFMDSLQALDAFRDTPDAFDVVIVDQVMTGLTGTALAREIIGIRPDIPIILSTGFFEQLDEQETKEAGVSEYVPKPVGPNELARAIRRVLKKSRSSRA